MANNPLGRLTKVNDLLGLFIAGIELHLLVLKQYLSHEFKIKLDELMPPPTYK
jgi:hypothetical protein